ncbi:MAG TPA: hypothetical protein VF691_18315 [Cytophagaceae bacterium]|jgi:hypothetical protein
MKSLNRRSFIKYTSASAGLITLGVPNEVLANVKEPAKSKRVTPLAATAIIYPELNMDEIPFSCAGSFLTINKNPDSPTGRLKVGTVRNTAVTFKWDSVWSNDYFEVALFDGEHEVSYTTKSYPWCLELTTPKGSGRIAFADKSTLAFEVQRLSIRLIPYKEFAYQHSKSPSELSALNFSGRVINQIRVPDGSLFSFKEFKNIRTKSDSPDSKGVIEASASSTTKVFLRMIPVESVWTEPLPSLDQVVAGRKSEIDTWMGKMAKVPDKYIIAAKIAWYSLWNNTASRLGDYTRTPILMNKGSMCRVWSWDNCFNAMCIAHADLKLAWDQIFLILDHQNENGMLPDAVSDLMVERGFVKPPIYGWAIMKIIETTGVEANKKYIKEAYPKIVKLTDWWYKFRDSDGDGMCEYLHGNDSGWDNATTMDGGIPVEGPDLAAHLVLQMEALAKMAQILGMPESEKMWQERAGKQMSTLLKKGVHNKKFVSRLSGKETIVESESLINYTTLELGKRIPKDIFTTMSADLKPGGPYLTKYGLSTEPFAGRTYEPNGYWRGPIWAPPTFQIFEGLREGGDKELAKIIAERFCDMVVDEPGMYENYNALTGKGQFAPNLCWTSNVFLLMAAWLHTSAK